LGCGAPKVGADESAEAFEAKRQREAGQEAEEAETF
jgi:hypothetical protein